LNDEPAADAIVALLQQFTGHWVLRKLMRGANAVVPHLMRLCRGHERLIADCDFEAD
jgi:hypothetical protein